MATREIVPGAQCGGGRDWSLRRAGGCLLACLLQLCNGRERQVSARQRDEVHTRSPRQKPKARAHPPTHTHAWPASQYGPHRSTRSIDRIARACVSRRIINRSIAALAFGFLERDRDTRPPHTCSHPSTAHNPQQQATTSRQSATASSASIDRPTARPPLSSCLLLGLFLLSVISHRLGRSEERGQRTGNNEGLLCHPASLKVRRYTHR
jgi:hypothetical protein